MEGGYSFEALNETPKEYECKICCQFLKDAVELTCSHAFCAECLVKWEKDKSKPSCPVCRKTYKGTEKQQSRVLNRIITTSLDVKCPLRDEGCTWTGKISDYQHHVCQFKTVQCPLEGCTEKMQLRLRKEHQKVCQYRLVVCSFCDANHKFKDQSVHLGECDEFVLKCPNNECDHRCKRKEIWIHKDCDCLYEEVDCPYKDVRGRFHPWRSDCERKILRKDLKEHKEKYIEMHCDRVKDYSVECNRKIGTLEFKNMVMERKISRQERKIEEQSEELKSLKRSLEEMKSLIEPTPKRKKKKEQK